jgi:hypothetical protein
MQQQTDLFTSRERGQAPELLMIEVEVEIGAIEAFACEAMSVDIRHAVECIVGSIGAAHEIAKHGVRSASGKHIKETSA